jgi:hypothetical protein
MRMAFGLVSLLVFVGIYMVWFGETQAPVIEQGNEAKKSAERIAGRGPDGLPATESATFEPQSKDGRTTSLRVTEVVPAGVLGQHFGLMKGDEIVRVGEFDVRDYPGGDDLAIAMTYEAAQRQSPLTVLRNGQRLTLTPGSKAPVAPGASPAPDAQDALDPVRKAVKIPMH